uniref:Putative conserved secreted protein n=1 Tax=Ixodes scapularis TaxID=6945 RepID=A0A4D5SA64_IXOSC
MVALGGFCAHAERVCLCIFSLLCVAYGTSRGKKEKQLVCDVRLKKFRCVVGWWASVPDWKQLCEIRCVHFFVVLEDFFFFLAV